MKASLGSIASSRPAWDTEGNFDVCMGECIYVHTKQTIKLVVVVRGGIC